MLSTEPNSDTPVSALGDPRPPVLPAARSAHSVAGADPALAPSIDSGPRRSGRRVAVGTAPDAVATAVPGVVSAPSVDLVVSPRRAARAAREAEAALALGSGGSAPAPQSPVIAPDVLAAATVSAALPALDVVAAPAAASAPAAAPGPRRRQSFVAAEPQLRTAAAPRRRVVRTLRTSSSTAPAGRPAAAPRSSAFATAARRVTIVTVVTGILATSILPVLAHSQGTAYAAGATGAAYVAPTADGQTYDVSASVNNAVSARDGYGATSVLDYESQVIANRQANKNTVYTGPTTAEYLAHPLYSKLDRSEVFQVALQYLGTPYVHGGEDPSAFDCSGLITFVYAQFGISLPHYVPSQDAVGRTIPESEAVPGDLVVFNSDDHDGIYAGNGMILDAPKPGGYVSVRPIWSAGHHFVRIDG